MKKKMITSRRVVKQFGFFVIVAFVLLMTIQWSEKLWSPYEITMSLLMLNQETISTAAEQRQNEEIMIPSHYFKYSPAKNQMKLYSLTYDCPGCKNPCKSFSKLQAMACKGRACLSDCSSPIYNHTVPSDNTYLINTQLLDAEKLTLHDDQITNKTRLPDITKLKLESLNVDQVLRIGEMITFKMIIYDGSGQVLKRGGDDVRVSVVQNKMRMAGRSMDYNNGTYLITVPALWNGTSTVFVVIPYYREEASTLFRWFRTLNSMFYHYGDFSNDKLIQSTLCMAGPNITGYSKVCNLSAAHNGGQPWFCGHPKSKHLDCKHFSGTGDYRFTDIGATSAEMKLFRRKCTNIGRTREVKVVVTGKIITKATIPLCKNLQPAKTWNLSSPTGYFNTESNYFSTQCRMWAQTTEQLRTCIKNTTIHLSGDSTTLQWYKALQHFSHCKPIHAPLFTGKWYEKVTCVRKEWNFTLKWEPHAMPFSFLRVNKLDINATSDRSLTDVLNGIPNKGRYIFVLHIFAHYTRVRYHIFREKVRAMLPALREALKRNTELQVVVKSPHVYYCVEWIPCVHDFMGRHLITILQQEMKGFVHQIKYLDYWDMSVSAANSEMHAGGDFIWQMVKLMIDHTCKSPI